MRYEHNLLHGINEKIAVAGAEPGRVRFGNHQSAHPAGDAPVAAVTGASPRRTFIAKFADWRGFAPATAAGQGDKETRRQGEASRVAPRRVGLPCRCVLVVLLALDFGGCRSRPTAPAVPANGLPGTAYTGGPPTGHEMAPPPPKGPPLPYQAHGLWSPPGIARPWPPEEYLCDGGDSGSPVAVSPNWEIYGLGLEDTVAHYDALDGRTLVEPSNKVCLYAPRFGAVRVITRVSANEKVDRAGGVERPQNLVKAEHVDEPVSSLQRYQARGGVGTKMASVYHRRQGDGALSNAVFAGAFQDAFLPFEDLSIIRNGIYDQAEKARLSEGVQAAVVWSEDVAVQAVLNGRVAIALTQDERTEEIFTTKDLRSPKLRVIKVASTQSAHPGEFVDFTLRFDNVGDQPLGNVVLVDNLTTRLEYVPDSAQSSLKARFAVEPNEAESLVLRWEIDDPINPGEGGIVRFRCRVR